MCDQTTRFGSKYIEGRDAVDYAQLLDRAGFVLRKTNPGKPWLGDLAFDTRNGVHVANLVAPTWPVYASGLEQDDEVRQLDEQTVRSEGDVTSVVHRHQPGDRMQMTFVDRTGRPRTAAVIVGENPHLEVVPIEAAGGTLTSAHRSFRESWLHSKS